MYGSVKLFALFATVFLGGTRLVVKGSLCRLWVSSGVLIFSILRKVSVQIEIGSVLVTFWSLLIVSVIIRMVRI